MCKLTAGFVHMLTQPSHCVGTHVRAGYVRKWARAYTQNLRQVWTCARTLARTSRFEARHGETARTHEMNAHMTAEAETVKAICTMRGPYTHVRTWNAYNVKQITQSSGTRTLRSEDVSKYLRTYVNTHVRTRSRTSPRHSPTCRTRHTCCRRRGQTRSGSCHSDGATPRPRPRTTLPTSCLRHVRTYLSTPTQAPSFLSS